MSQLVKDGAVAINRFKLSTLENRPAMIQTGQTKGVVTGRSQQFGGSRAPTTRSSSANTYSNQDFGTIVQVTAKANDSGELTLNLEFESSRYDEPRAVAVKEGEEPEFKLGQVVTAVARTTIRVTSGEATLLNSIEQSGLEDGRRFVLLVKGSVVVAKDKQAAAKAEADPKRQITVYHLKNADAKETFKVLQELLKESKSAVHVVVDQRNNSLLVSSAGDEEAKLVEDILRVVDADNPKLDIQGSKPLRGGAN